MSSSAAAEPLDAVSGRADHPRNDRCAGRDDGPAARCSGCDLRPCHDHDRLADDHPVIPRTGSGPRVSPCSTAATFADYHGHRGRHLRFSSDQIVDPDRPSMLPFWRSSCHPDSCRSVMLPQADQCRMKESMVLVMGAGVNRERTTGLRLNHFFRFHAGWAGSRTLLVPLPPRPGLQESDK